jgi:hypothetical protein
MKALIKEELVPTQQGSKGPARPFGGVRGVHAAAIPLPPPFVLTERQLAAKAALSGRLSRPRGGTREKGPVELQELIV